MFGGGFDAVNWVEAWVSALLPPPSLDTVPRVAGAISAFQAFLPYIAYASFWMDLSAYLTVFALILFIEFLLIFPRIWAFILRMTPFA